MLLLLLLVWMVLLFVLLLYKQGWGSWRIMKYKDIEVSPQQPAAWPATMGKWFLQTAMERSKHLKSESH